MYEVRDFSLVTVSANMPDEQPSVLKFFFKRNTLPAATCCFLRTTLRHYKLPLIRNGIRRFPIPFCSPQTARCSIRQSARSICWSFVGQLWPTCRRTIRALINIGRRTRSVRDRAKCALSA